MEVLREDLSAIDVDFLWPGNPGIERALIGVQRIVECADLPLKPAEVEPAVGKFRIGAQGLAISSDRLWNPSGGVQLRCVAKQGTPILFGHAPHLIERRAQGRVSKRLRAARSRA